MSIIHHIYLIIKRLQLRQVSGMTEMTIESVFGTIA